MVETERVARRLPRELILWFVPPDGGAEDRVTAETSMGEWPPERSESPKEIRR